MAGVAQVDAPFDIEFGFVGTRYTSIAGLGEVQIKLG